LPLVNSWIEKKNEQMWPANEKSKKSRKDADWLNYKKSRNSCNNLLRKTKGNFHKEQLNENDLNPKKFWKCIKKIFPSKGQSCVPNARDNSELAKKFSLIFASCVQNLIQKAMPMKDLISGSYHKNNHSHRKKLSNSSMSQYYLSRKN